MSSRAVYLAKYGPKSSRGHFAIFVPNLKYNSNTLETDWRKGHCVGTIIHVVGEPLMAGFALEFKRNYDCFLSTGLLKLLLLGAINDTYLFQLDSDKIVREAVPRCLVETIASKVRPPPKGQDIRAPIDGVKTKRCQEWTMEFLALLVEHELIHEDAINVAQAQRDSPTYGIFGLDRKK